MNMYVRASVSMSRASSRSSVSMSVSPSRSKTASMHSTTGSSRLQNSPNVRMTRQGASGRSASERKSMSSGRARAKHGRVCERVEAEGSWER